MREMHIQRWAGKLGVMKPGIDFIGVAVGAVVLNEKGEMLLAKRSQTVKNERGCWENPGGSVELGEGLEEAVRREVREELGVEVDLLKQLPAVDHFIPEESQHWVTTTFIVRIKSDDPPKIMEPEKCDEIGCFTFNNLPQPLSIITKTDIRHYQDFLNC